MLYLLAENNIKYRICIVIMLWF